MPTTVDKTCRICGKHFLTENPRRLLCPECRINNRKSVWSRRPHRVCKTALVGFRSQEEVARILGCSRTNVQNIEVRAFSKLWKLRQDPALRDAWEQVRGALPEVESVFETQFKEMVALRDRLRSELKSDELAQVNKDLDLCQLGIERIKAIKL